MAEFILGMIGAILAIAAYKGGFYIGRQSLKGERLDNEAIEIDEEEIKRREQIIKDINKVFSYQGRKGRDK